jgi:capsule assembly protein Wzi
MVISTEAPTMPSITLSNYRPLTRLGLQYEFFVARMSQTDQIELTNGEFTRGFPKFAGIHLGIEPASGWSLAVNRALVFGGGAAGGQSIQDVLNALANPSKGQSTGFGGGKNIGKQEASITSRFIFPGKMPFAVYLEYAGNDTSDGRNYLLGKPDLSAGIHLPHLGPFDVTYEISEWEATWYIHPMSPVQTGYLDGITNYGRIIGHWFGDQRQFGDAVGGQSNMLRVGWEPPSGGRLETQYRVLKNGSYSTVPYRHEYTGSVTYSYPWRGYAIGAEVDAGQDVFGGHFARLAGFMRYGDALLSPHSDSADSASTARRADGAELSVDVGMNANRVLVDITNVAPRYETSPSFGPHLGLGARRKVSEHQDLGVRVEADDIRGHALIAVRAVDYRYRFSGPLALNAFFGAARYAVATPAYGYYLGTGVQWRDVLPGWDLGLDYRYGWKLARKHDLPSDPQGNRPDSFYDINSLSLYVSRKF